MAGIGGFIEQAQAIRAQQQEREREAERESARRSFWEKIRPEPEPVRQEPDVWKRLEQYDYAAKENNIANAPWVPEFGRQQQKEQERQSWNDNRGKAFDYAPPPNFPMPDLSIPSRPMFDLPLTGDQSERADRPPKPLTMPQANPVSALKNQTALQLGYTPEASRTLYDTPTMVNYGRGSMQELDAYAPPSADATGIGGTYIPDPLRRAVAEHDIYLNDPNKFTLGHEFAHKWYYEEMPKWIQRDWEAQYGGKMPAWMPPYIIDIVRENPELYDESSIPVESYAYAAETGPNYLDDEIRNRYYAGLFEGDTKEWEKRPSWVPEFAQPAINWWVKQGLANG